MDYAYLPVWAGDASALAGFQLRVSPAGMTVDPTLGQIAWTPTTAQIGEHAVTLVAVVGGRDVEQQWTIRVSQATWFGVALSPRGHSASTTTQDWVDHLTMPGVHGAVRSFHGAWRDSGMTNGEVPQLARTGAQWALDYGFVAAFGFGWSDGAGNPDLTSDSEPSNNSWSNVETRREFREMVTAFAGQWQPRFLFLGNETNVWFQSHTQNEWMDWVSEFGECYDAIKQASPATEVFTVFQLEMMKGVGRHNGWSNAPQWQLLADHAATGKIDTFGFTVYPYFEHDTPGQVPDSYLQEIRAHWTSPVAFTEVAWPAMARPPYSGDEADQAAFVRRFLSLAAELDVSYLSWLFVHDWDGQASTPAFTAVGLRANDGTPRAADLAWQEEIAARELRR
ncbi:MAG: Ig domain-containing protein [Planctomycetota bacterium]